MSIDVYYQPIDVSLVHNRLLPFVFHQRDDHEITSAVSAGDPAASGIMQLRDAHECLLQENDYYSTEWGRCDPDEFLYDMLVRNVLDYCRKIFPYWHVRAITSIQLLPDHFPVLEHYQMPIDLFLPAADKMPDLIASLATIAECEEMGGLIPATSVPLVENAVRGDYANRIRNPEDPYEYDATASLLEALQYAVAHKLSFTEAIC